MSDERLLIVPVPTLVSTLCRAERDKGSPLSHDEVIGVRDRCVCVRVPESVARKMAESRGYEDIDPEHCWEQWQQARVDLTSDAGGA